ncbi:MAG: hypothetical protein ACI4HI_18600 [Lachnospiraceae bacterium]
MREYRVVYNYNGYTIEAGQNGWIPSREIAERVLEKKRKSSILRDQHLYLEERENPDAESRTKCRNCNGKEVINHEWLYCDALNVGDYVEAEVVSNFMDCLIPACMRSDCSQIGSPHSMRIDEDGKTKSTFLTFKRVDKDTWEYCGENYMHGTELPWV